MIPTGMLIMLGTAAFGVWNMPDALRWCVVRFMARAEAVTARKRIYEAAVKHWSEEFGLETK